MNLKALAGFTIYYLLIGLFFAFGSSFLGGGTTTATSPDFGDTNYSVNETAPPIDSNYYGSVFGAIQKFIEICAFMFFGIGLPAGTPAWFQILFSAIMTGIFIMALAVVLDAIHSG